MPAISSLSPASTLGGDEKIPCVQGGVTVETTPTQISTYVNSQWAYAATIASGTYTFTNKTYDTAGAGNSFKINGTAISAVTGSGSVVLASAPTLVTPALGVGTATSIAIGGAAIGANALAVTGTVAVAGGITVTGVNDITSGQNMVVPGPNEFYWSGRAHLKSPADNTLQLTNNAETVLFNLSWPVSNVLQFGLADAASPVAQTLQFQNGSGSNIAAVNATVIAPLATGNATNGDIIFQTGVKVGSGSGAPTKTTALTIKGETQQVVAANGTSANPSYSFAGAVGDGYGWQTSGTLQISIGASPRYFITTSQLYANTASSFALIASAASSTVPTLIPHSGSTTTGLGAQASGNLSVILSGAENTRFISTGVTTQIGTAIPAGGTAATGYMFSSTSNFGVFFGSGVPTLSASQGSLYLRSDGSSTSTRLYVNTNGSTGWTAVTTAT